ncbi:MAG TPA: beta-propeller fold lactonase family protein [Candidatus Angelobacter sp.]|nr:beta-propeller fold lactonase family protein [Candidatus Angelobacter sp.]
MKSFVSAFSVFALGLLATISLAGCGSVSPISLAATPTPAPVSSNPSSPTPTPAAHGTFVFSNSQDHDTPVTGYRLNGDGTLSAIPGSPFPANGFLTVSGSFLISAQDDTVVAFRIDPATGALTLAGSGNVPGAIAVAADGANVYAAGTLTPAGSGTGIYGFSIAPNGALSPLAGSPYFFAGGCDTCSSPLTLALNDKFLIQGGAGFHGIRNFTVYPRMAGGALGSPQTLATEAGDRVAIQHPAGKFAYTLNVSDGELANFTVDASGNPIIGATMFTGSSQDITVDTTGKFLLLVDLSGVVHVFTIDPATGDLSQIATSESAGNGALAIAMDPSGQFVLVSQSAAISNLPGAANQVTIFTFDSATGAVKKLQSYPVSKEPGRVVIASM